MPLIVQSKVFFLFMTHFWTDSTPAGLIVRKPRTSILKQKNKTKKTMYSSKVNIY